MRQLIMMIACGLALILTACENDPGVEAKVDAARARNDGPPIWKVTAPNGEAGGELYLYGAVHILPEGTDWLRPDIDKILSAAGTVFFETGYDEASRLELDIITARDGYYHSGQSLPARLDGYNQQRLFAATLNVGLRDQTLNRMKPWLAADILSMATLEQAGLTGAGGADVTLHAIAKKRGKYIRYLESMDAHMAATAIVSDERQLAELKLTLDRLDGLAERTQKLNTAWLRGDTDYIERVVIAPLRTDAPDYFNALFTIRNQAWADSLAPFVIDGGHGLVVVGVGHMVGEGSLPEALAAKGLTVTRYYAHQGQNVLKTIDLDIGG